jgi:hypothetical protein
MDEARGDAFSQDLKLLSRAYRDCLLRFLSRSNLTIPEAQDQQARELQLVADRIRAEVRDSELQLALAYFERPNQDPRLASSRCMLHHVQALKSGQTHQYRNDADPDEFQSDSPRAVDLVFEQIAPGPLHDFFCTTNRLHKALVDCSSPDEFAKTLGAEAALGTDLGKLARQATRLRRIEIPNLPHSDDPAVWKMTVDRYVTSELLFVEALVHDHPDPDDDQKQEEDDTVVHFCAVASERCRLLAPYVTVTAIFDARCLTRVFTLVMSEFGFGQSNFAALAKWSEADRRKLMFMTYDACLRKVA